MKKSLLLFLFCFLTQMTFSQCYSVSQVTYAPDSFNLGTGLTFGHDDLFSDTIPLPFSFCFYGASYSKIVIGENGVISFNASDRNNYCVWPINSSIPSTMLYKNSIFFPYQDLISSQTPTFYYTTYGVTPNRRFVVSINRCPMYIDTSKHFTGEVMLYETSNEIEIHNQNKQLVATWNGGFGIEGIQDASGISAVVVPGRNYPTQWTATNDAWRFTPICNVCNPLGKSNIAENNSFELYPNPASSEIHLKYYNTTSQKFSVQLQDYSGRIIYQEEYSSEMERTLKPNVASGIYFVRLVSENGETLEIKKLAID